MKTFWKKAENYHTLEISLENGYLIYKDWSDPGKNPSVQKISFEDILAGKLNFEIVMEFEPWILREIKENIRKLMGDIQKD